MRAGAAMAAVSALLALGGCGGATLPAGMPAASTPPPTTGLSGWRAVATPADRARLRNWRATWLTALAEARAAGHGAEIAKGGALFVPDAAIDGATPPPGDYRCRVVKLGSAGSPNGLGYVAYPFFRCRIAAEGPQLSFAKLDGSQRPVGLLFNAGDGRTVFLGTMLLGDERRAIDYGRDSERDMGGLVQRIGPERWRLVLPRPRWESTLDIMELEPAE